jgi:hypothetical protein
VVALGVFGADFPAPVRVAINPPTDCNERKHSLLR